MIHIGDFLKEKRQEKGLSLESVAQQTKININILKNLEENHFKQLPNPAYLKGFVISYARILGLTASDVTLKLEYSYLMIVGKPFPTLNHTKSNAIQEGLEKKTSSKDENKKISEDKPHDVLEESETLVMKKKFGTYAGISLATLSIILAAVYFASSMINQEISDLDEKPVTQKTPPKTQPLETNEQADSVESSPELEAITSDDVAKKDEPEEKLPQRVFPERSFAKVFEPLFTYDENEELVSNPELFPESIKNKHLKDSHNVFINSFYGKTWVTYRVDSDDIRGTLLDKGETLFLHGNVLTMFIGDISSVQIYFDKKPLKRSEVAEAKSLIFPEEVTKDFSLPLFVKANNGTIYTSKEYIRQMEAENEKFNNLAAPE